MERDDADCGNELFDYMFGSPEYYKWKYERERLWRYLGTLIITVECTAMLFLIELLLKI